MNGERMLAEIEEQPSVFRRILRNGRPEIDKVADAIRLARPRFVLLLARGTSDHAALYAKYLIEIELGLPAGLVSPSSFTIYDAKLDVRNVLFIAVSQSGRSPDLVAPMQSAREGGALTLALTNDPQSPLADAAQHHIDILAGPERAVAATKSYTAQLLCLFLLVEALTSRDGSAINLLAEQAESVLARSEEVADLATRYRFAEHLVVTSRGYNYATARETALKLMETSYLVASAFSAADLLHGPMAMIDRGFPVIAIVPRGRGGSSLHEVLRQLHARGADTLVVGDVDALHLGSVGIPVPTMLDESITPLLTILPMQRLAWQLARERGDDPDQPRGLSKVTATW